MKKTRNCDASGGQCLIAEGRFVAYVLSTSVVRWEVIHQNWCEPTGFVPALLAWPLGKWALLGGSEQPCRVSRGCKPVGACPALAV